MDLEEHLCGDLEEGPERSGHTICLRGFEDFELVSVREFSLSKAENSVGDESYAKLAEEEEEQHDDENRGVGTEVREDLGDHSTQGVYREIGEEGGKGRVSG